MASAPRKYRWGAAAIALPLIAIGAWAVMHRKAPAQTLHGGGPASVTTAQASLQDVTLTIDALGSAQAWRSAVIKAQVNGRLLDVPVKEGADVPAGAVLARIDPAPYRAALAQAEGALARDEALLQDAKLNLARDQKLEGQGWIARQAADTQAAQVKQYEGVVAMDRASVQTAQINLGYCNIKAPYAGRIGVRQVDPGNLVSATDATGLLTINEITPIAVTFTVPQGEFSRLAEASNGFKAPLAVQALSQETGASLGIGALSVADNHVDPASGTVALKAKFSNGDRSFWPGQFVNVRLKVQSLPNALVVPLAAVNQGPKGPFAYVVGADHHVAARPIVVAARQDASAVIASGLKPGEVVVTDGQMVLKPGMAVRVQSAAGDTGTGAAHKRRAAA